MIIVILNRKGVLSWFGVFSLQLLMKPDLTLWKLLFQPAWSSWFTSGFCCCRDVLSDAFGVLRHRQ